MESGGARGGIGGDSRSQRSFRVCLRVNRSEVDGANDRGALPGRLARFGRGCPGTAPSGLSLATLGPPRPGVAEASPLRRHHAGMAKASLVAEASPLRRYHLRSWPRRSTPVPDPADAAGGSGHLCRHASSSWPMITHPTRTECDWSESKSESERETKLLVIR